MIRLLTFALLAVSTLRAAAQLPVALDKLEGVWNGSLHGSPVQSEWVFFNDYTLDHRLYAHRQGDTVEYLRMRIVETERHTPHLILSGGAYPLQTFQLVLANACELVWENLDPAQFPTCLRFEFTGTNRLLIKGLEEPIDLYYEKKEKMKFRLGGLFGAFYQQSPVGFTTFEKNHISDLQYQRKPGQQFALSLLLRRENAPLGVRIESGYRQSEGILSYATDNDYYRIYGYGAHKDWYVGVAPEGFFGKNRQWSCSVGFHFHQGIENAFKGTSTYSDAAGISTTLPYFKNAANFSYFSGTAGAAWRLPLGIKNIQPTLVTRGVFGSVRGMRAWMLGIQLDIGR
jgi:hypothetical protein